MLFLDIPGPVCVAVRWLSDSRTSLRSPRADSWLLVPGVGYVIACLTDWANPDARGTLSLHHNTVAEQFNARPGPVVTVFTAGGGLEFGAISFVQNERIRLAKKVADGVGFLFFFQPFDAYAPNTDRYRVFEIGCAEILAMVSCFHFTCDCPQC